MTRPDPTNLARQMLAAAKKARQSAGLASLGDMDACAARAEYIHLALANVTALAEAYLALQSRIDRALAVLIPLARDTSGGAVARAGVADALEKAIAALTGADHD